MHEIKFTYTNYKGVKSIRRVKYPSLAFGNSAWHEGDQWFFRAYCMDRKEYRDFALKDCDFTTTDETEVNG